MPISTVGRAMLWTWPTMEVTDLRGKTVNIPTGEILAEEFSPHSGNLIAEVDGRGLLDRQLKILLQKP